MKKYEQPTLKFNSIDVEDIIAQSTTFIIDENGVKQTIDFETINFDELNT